MSCDTDLSKAGTLIDQAMFSAEPVVTVLKKNYRVRYETYNCCKVSHVSCNQYQNILVGCGFSMFTVFITVNKNIYINFTLSSKIVKTSHKYIIMQEI